MLASEITVSTSGDVRLDDLKGDRQQIKKGGDFWEHGNKTVQCVNFTVTTDPSGSHQRWRRVEGFYTLSEL